MHSLFVFTMLRCVPHRRRLAVDSGRKDFLTNFVAKVQAGELDREELTAHSSTLVIAGGETVATFLAAVTYFLLRNPATYAKLRDEIRTRYSSADQIDARTAQLLPYLQAVIAEGLRMYPPGSQGFPRISPGAVVDGVWVPQGTECYTSAWSPTHDERYFHEPYVFKPERWVDPNCADVKEASQPFSLGPRGCLGRKYVNLFIVPFPHAFHFVLGSGEVCCPPELYQRGIRKH